MRDLLLLYLVHYSEVRYVPAMLKGVELWLVSGITVLDEPHCPSLHSVQEGEMPVRRASPRKARVLQGGTNLSLVQDLQAFIIKEPRDPPE